MLRVRGLAVRGEVRDGLVQRLGLGGLVLDILILGRRLDGVFLGLLLVPAHRVLLGARHLCDTLCEVRLNNLEQADDAGAGPLARGVCLVLLGVVLVQDLQCHLDALKALLHVGLVLGVLLLLLGAEFVHFRLAGRQLAQGRLERGDLLLQGRGAGGHLVDLRGHLLDLGGLLVLLLVRLRQLLVTIGLFGGIRLGLGLKLLDHIGDEALDFAEDVVAAVGAGADRGCHPGSQLRELRGLVLAGEVAHEAGSLVLAEAAAGGDASLHEGDLIQAIAQIVRTAGVLLERRLGRRQGVQLLAAALGLGLEVLGLGHAVVVEGLLGLDVGSQLLGGHLEVALGSGFLLGAHGDLHLRCLHILVCELDLVLQTLLQHLEILHSRGLLLAAVIQLPLGLVREALQGVQEVAALALVDSARRGTDIQGLLIGLGLGIRRGAGGLLHEGGKLRGVGVADQRGLDHDIERLDQVVSALQLQHGRAALLHLALNDARCARDHVDGLHELALLLNEVRVLLLADGRGIGEIRLVRGDGGHELLNLDGPRRDGRRLLADGCLKRIDLGRSSLDLVAELSGLVLAPLGELCVNLLPALTLCEDLRLQVLNHGQHLADRGIGHRHCEQGRGHNCQAHGHGCVEDRKSDGAGTIYVVGE
mmetsp:Transcript_17610/g.44317  ORF Transcript_17610/g.44317 Transcript_17610/m.44317 type:complete len:645 (-) Transcript_17610:35-1969(-)